jgi:hypothetical protein
MVSMTSLRVAVLASHVARSLLVRCGALELPCVSPPGVCRADMTWGMGMVFHARRRLSRVRLLVA